jgi:cytochrome c5
VINRVIFSLVAAVLAVSAFAVDLTPEQRKAVEERIKPVGESCMKGDATCGGAAAPAGGAARSGEEVFKATCFACHGTGAAGAPKFGDTTAWAPRIAKGIDTLHHSALNGVPGTGMIAKGGCATCSDEEVLAAVDYMVKGSK